MGEDPPLWACPNWKWMFPHRRCTQLGCICKWPRMTTWRKATFLKARPTRSQTLNPRLETVNLKPSTRNLSPEARNPKPEILSPKFRTRNLETWTLNPVPSTLDTQTQSLHPSLWTPNQTKSDLRNVWSSYWWKFQWTAGGYATYVSIYNVAFLGPSTQNPKP